MLNRPNPKAASITRSWKVRKEMDATWLAVVAVGHVHEPTASAMSHLALLAHCLPLYVDLPDFGIPIHLGVLFMYSR